MTVLHFDFERNGIHRVG